MAITQVLPLFTTTPNRNTPSTFSADTDQYHLELTPFVPKLNIWAEQVNTLKEDMNTLSENVFNQPFLGGYSQAYLDNEFAKKVNIDGDQTINDIKIFTLSPIVPTPTAPTQVANKDYVDTSSPTGVIIAYSANTPPLGFLECNGSTLSRTSYANLFATIGTVYGIGDGSTTFQIPDLRGEFIRGWDNGRGVDAGRLIGSFQADEFKSHYHQNGASTTSLYILSGGSYPLVQTNNTSSVGGTETRPRNIAMMYCIKY